jgi:hypothetical protein
MSLHKVDACDDDDYDDDDCDDCDCDDDGDCDDDCDDHQLMCVMMRIVMIIN